MATKPATVRFVGDWIKEMVGDHSFKKVGQAANRNLTMTLGSTVEVAMKDDEVVELPKGTSATFYRNYDDVKLPRVIATFYFSSGAMMNVMSGGLCVRLKPIVPRS